MLTESEGTSTIDQVDASVVMISLVGSNHDASLQAHKVAAMLEGSNIKILKLVTSEFHIIRAKRCFNKYFHGYVADIPVSSALNPVKMREAVNKETELLEEYTRRGWI